MIFIRHTTYTADERYMPRVADQNLITRLLFIETTQTNSSVLRFSLFVVHKSKAAQPFRTLTLSNTQRGVRGVRGVEECRTLMVWKRRGSQLKSHQARQDRVLEVTGPYRQSWSDVTDRTLIPLPIDKKKKKKVGFYFAIQQWSVCVSLCV